MSWDTIKDNMTAFLGVLILLVPLIREALKSGKKSWGYILFLVLCCGVLLWLGCDKTSRDNRKDIEAKAQHTQDTIKLNSMQKSIDSLFGKIDKDSIDRAKFMKHLDSSFHIRDSSNIPVRIYNTQIGRAENVTIG